MKDPYVICGDGREAFPELEDALYSLHLPAEFDRRCREASLAAFAIDRMRRELECQAPSPLPFGQFMSALADRARVSLEAVVASVGAANLDQVTAVTVPALARLARLLGLPRDSAQLLLPMGFQAFREPEAAGAMQLAYRGAQRVPIERGFEDWEERCPENVRAELVEIRRLIDEEYKDAE